MARLFLYRVRPDGTRIAQVLEQPIYMIGHGAGKRPFAGAQ
jgi:hypothetical protein